MAVKLNLLPPEYGATRGLSSILKVTRALGIISVALLLVFAISVSVFFIISSLTLKGLNSDVDSLKGRISSLEKSEQQIVLLKDRLSKIKTVLGLANASETIVQVNPYLSNLPANSGVKELSVDPGAATFTVEFSSTSDLANFLDRLSSVTEFKSVSLTSFNYSSLGGYTVGVSTSSK